MKKLLVCIAILNGIAFGADSQGLVLASSDYPEEESSLFPFGYNIVPPDYDSWSTEAYAEPLALKCVSPTKSFGIGRSLFNVGASSLYALGSGIGALAGLSSLQEKDTISLNAQLKMAVANKDIELLEELVQVNGAKEAIFLSAQNDLSLFAFICLQGDAELIKMFASIYPDMIDCPILDQKTPLTLILEKQDPETARTLLQLGANPDKAGANQLIASILLQEHENNISKDESVGQKLKTLIMTYDAVIRGKAIDTMVKESLTKKTVSLKKIHSLENVTGASRETRFA